MGFGGNALSTIIDIEGVYWERDGKSILNNVRWRVTRGEHWALLGLNGSGKTTLLNIVSGYVWPTAGRVSVLGHEYGSVDLRELRKRIGWVSSAFEERLDHRDKALHVVVSGLHASIGLFEKPAPDQLEHALRLMEGLDCRHVAHRPYATCSHGEKQKVLIARALMAEPELLILDEPCTGLDFVARESLLQTVARLARAEDGPTLVYVTHHPEEIVPEFTHTLLLRSGTVTAQGWTEQVLTGAALSEAFGVSVQVIREGGRRWVVPAKGPARVTRRVTCRNT